MQIPLESDIPSLPLKHSPKCLLHLVIILDITQSQLTNTITNINEKTKREMNTKNSLHIIDSHTLTREIKKMHKEEELRAKNLFYSG